MLVAKKRYVVGLAVAVASLVTGTASAHVVVKPAEVLTGAFQSFNVGVPNEKEVPVTQVKLTVPDGLQYVTPTVKNGWTINVEKEGSGESAKVKSITWSGGSIPTGLRDDFGFSAKTPDKATDIQWKAYQTYEDGVTVNWDKNPKDVKEDDESGTEGPYSVTKVAATASASGVADSHGDDGKATDTQARLMSIIALAVAFVAFSLATRKNAQAATGKTKK